MNAIARRSVTCKIKKQVKRNMNAEQGTMVLLEAESGSGIGNAFIQSISTTPLHLQVVTDEDSLQKILWDLLDDAKRAVVVCAPLTTAGSASEVLHRMRATGGNSGFVGYGDFTREQLVELIRLGADEVVMAPEANGALPAAIDRAFRRVTARIQRDQEEQATRQQVTALKAALNEREDQCRAARGVAIETLLMALAVREPDAICHSLRVQAYASHLARLSGYPERMLEPLEQAALLHDVGKIGMSDQILFRNGWLSHQELQQLEPHAEFGARILERIEFLRPLAPIVRHHHERFDGQGFPAGLTGNAIPLGARIFSIADSLDAMTSDKPYRAAMTFEVAAQEIYRSSGKQFDPQLVEHFLSVAPSKWSSIRDQVLDEFRGRSALFAFPETVPLGNIA
jgi:putative nucleotidyltransferase with HDIG domain